jgi:hypothetical protein
VGGFAFAPRERAVDGGGKNGLSMMVIMMIYDLSTVEFDVG